VFYLNTLLRVAAGCWRNVLMLRGLASAAFLLNMEESANLAEGSG
jgi:hypothetical protein